MRLGCTGAALLVMSAAKRIKIDGPGEAAAAFGSLSVDAIAIVFGYLGWKDILRARVSRACRDAATRTLVPFAADDKSSGESLDFYVSSLRKYECLTCLARALPNLQQIYFATTLAREAWALRMGRIPFKTPSDGVDGRINHPPPAESISLPAFRSCSAFV